MAGDRIVRLAPDLRASEDIAAAIDDETSCVIVQSPDFFGNPRDLTPIAEAAHAHGALLIAVFTDPVALGAAALARRDGRRHRRRRRAGDRQRAEFRRPLCRPVRDARQERAPDAGPARRRDGRRGRAAQLRADALDPRAAHPPREGDEQHLHELRPMRARVLDPSDAARRRRARAPGEGQSRQRGRSRRAAVRDSVGRGASIRISSTSSRCARQGRRRN